MSLSIQLFRYFLLFFKTIHLINSKDKTVETNKRVSSRMGIIARLKFAHLTLVPVFKNYVILFYHWSVYHSRPQKLFLQLLALESKWLENPLAVQQNLLALHFCMIMSSPNWQIREKCVVVCILYLVVTFMLFWHYDHHHHKNLIFSVINDITVVKYFLYADLSQQLQHLWSRI